MSKRFTDTERFRDPWYRKLSPVQKCIWEYALSECDIAGFLTIDLEAMSFHIGADIGREDLLMFDGRFVWVSDEVIFIPKFIVYQNGQELNPANGAHKAIIRLLEQRGVDPSTLKLKSEMVKGEPGVNTGSMGGLPPLSNSKGKSIGLSNRGIVKGEREKKFRPPTIDEVTAYCTERGNTVNPQKWFDFYTSKGWKVGNQPMKDWQAAVRTWEGREAETGQPSYFSGVAGSAPDAGRHHSREELEAFLGRKMEIFEENRS